MLFNSIDFAVFVPLVFILYWFVFHRNLQVQNLFIVLVSYIFYGWWDPRFLILLFISSITDFGVGLGFLRFKNPYHRKYLLAISIIVNLSILGFFKYFNFFVDNFTNAFSLMGMNISSKSLDIILPVGISFYTFQTLSYSIDVYKNKLAPTRDFISFAAYVSFFPQLVAGPIERAVRFLPQFTKKRIFSRESSENGLKQILWGFFKKLVIADNCAIFSDMFFNNSDIYPGSALLLGAFFFSFQIYGDFSGYSDIAIGTARLFGFELMKNFDFPYFSKNIAEFWRSWHISLTSWFKDYVYIPLGGNKVSSLLKIRNVFLVFIISGFWHGANWTFIIWGILHAILFLPLLLVRKNRIEISTKNYLWPKFSELIKMVTTFLLVTILWIFFRANTIEDAFGIISKIFSSSLFILPIIKQGSLMIITMALILVFVFMEWKGRANSFAIENFFVKSIKQVRWSFYAFLIFLIGMYMQSGGSPFIYFQF